QGDRRSAEPRRSCGCHPPRSISEQSNAGTVEEGREAPDRPRRASPLPMDHALTACRASPLGRILPAMLARSMRSTAPLADDADDLFPTGLASRQSETVAPAHVVPAVFIGVLSGPVEGTQLVGVSVAAARFQDPSGMLSVSNVEPVLEQSVEVSAPGSYGLGYSPKLPGEQKTSPHLATTG